ncbi:MAG: arylsulfatase A, partial [Pirellulaceae bacterium]
MKPVRSLLRIVSVLTLIRQTAEIVLVLAVFGVTSISLAASPSVGKNQKSKPNVIVIMADDVGYECFGCYGSKQYQTPNIDQLAAKGMRFNHCYSQPLCTPSRVKIMTGLSNVRNYSAFSVLNSDQKTIGHYFQDAGYETLVAGKWQLLGANHYSEQ